jgi:hypothetical protein
LSEIGFRGTFNVSVAVTSWVVIAVYADDGDDDDVVVVVVVVVVVGAREQEFQQAQVYQRN